MAAGQGPARTKAPELLTAEPQSFIFTCDAQELIAVNSCAGCKAGALAALFCTTNTPFLLILLHFKGYLTKDLGGFDSSNVKINKLIAAYLSSIMRHKGETIKHYFFFSVFFRFLLKTTTVNL